MYFKCSHVLFQCLCAQAGKGSVSPSLPSSHGLQRVSDSPAQLTSHEPSEADLMASG